MTKKDKILNYIREQIPSLKELSFGCEIENLFFYKTEADKKAKKPDWKRHTSEYGLRGTIVKDLREDFLPMWVDYGDQLEFCVEPNDIVSFDIIGHQVELRHLLMCIEKKWPQEKYVISSNGFIGHIDDVDHGDPINYNISATLEQNLESSEELADFIINILEIK